MDDVRPPTLLGRLSRAAHGISFQLMAVLSLAVLPIAAIAVWHSVVFSQESRRTAEILLLGLTEERVTLEHRLIEAGLQINPKQIASASLLASGGAACSQNLASFVFQHPIFQSAAFVPAGGISLCASDGLMRDLRSDAAHLQFLETPAPHVDRVPFVNGAMAPILRVLQPVYENGAFIGYLSLVLQAFPLPFVQKLLIATEN